MDFRFTPEEEEFRNELREFIRKELPPSIKGRYTEGPSRWIGGKDFAVAPTFPEYKEFLKKVGARGWIGMSWPKEYGGGGEKSIMKDFILREEFTWAGAPRMGTAEGIVGPTVLQYGSEQLKREYVPRIARGEIEFSLGYTEPEAGTDTANIQTRAVKDGDEYVINGQKIFSSGAHYADYCWLCARTADTKPKHRGLSLFIIPQRHPSIVIQRPRCIGGMLNNFQYFDNLRIPATNLVGEENRGFYYMMTALDFERLPLYSWRIYMPTLLEVMDYCRETEVDGKPLSKDPAIREKLAHLYMENQIARLLVWRTADVLERGIVPNYEAAMIKLYHSELQQRECIAATNITGHYGLLASESKMSHPRMRGNMDLENMYRCTVQPIFAGGTANVMRTIIAMRGMGLPRAY